MEIEYDLKINKEKHLLKEEGDR